MTAIISYLHGIYPHSQQLVTVTRDAARGRCPASGVAQQRQADRQALAALQRKAGLDYITSGLLGWHDLFRPLVAACPGWTTGPLRRWFDNNTFVRVLVVRGTVRLDRALFTADSGEVATLPGPYTFSRIADTYMARDKLIEAIAAGVLRPAAEELISRGARLIQLQEPWLAAHGIAGHCSGAGSRQGLGYEKGSLRGRPQRTRRSLTCRSGADGNQARDRGGSPGDRERPQLHDREF